MDMQEVINQLNSVGMGLFHALAPHLPRLFGALAILVGAWIGARLLRGLVLRAATASGLDQRLQVPGLAATLASIAAGLVWLIALPALLGSLDLQGLLVPVNAMMARLLGFLPNLMGAVVVGGIGVLMARIARQLVSGLLSAAGADRAASRLGMGNAFGAEGLPGMAGNVVFALLLLPVLVAALQPLGLDAVTQPLSALLESVISFIPRLIAAGVVLGLGLLLARVASTLVSAMTDSANINKFVARIGGPVGGMGGRSWGDLLGTVVFVAIGMAALTQACQLLALPVVTDAVMAISLQMVRTGAAVVIMVVALVLANLAGRAIETQAVQAGQPHPRVWSWVCRAAILFLAGALALHQAGLPPVIVSIAFGAVAGALALGVAVALGIGGGPVVGALLQRASQALAPPRRSTAGPSGGGNSNNTNQDHGARADQTQT
jgi:Conserved TM helix